MKLFDSPPFYQLTLHLGVLSSDLDAVFSGTNMTMINFYPFRSNKTDVYSCFGRVVCF